MLFGAGEGGEIQKKEGKRLLFWQKKKGMAGKRKDLGEGIGTDAAKPMSRVSCVWAVGREKKKGEEGGWGKTGSYAVISISNRFGRERTKKKFCSGIKG